MHAPAQGAMYDHVQYSSRPGRGAKLYKNHTVGRCGERTIGISSWKGARHTGRNWAPLGGNAPLAL